MVDTLKKIGRLTPIGWKILALATAATVTVVSQLDSMQHVREVLLSIAQTLLILG